MRMVLPLFLLVGCPTPGDDDIKGDENADADGDGLTDGEEADLGSDPASSDSDGDGFADKEEVDAGFSPTWEYSHPYEEGDYLIGACPVHPDDSVAGPTGTASMVYQGQTYEWTAYQQGDVMLNLENTDSFGQDLPLYAFCGNYVVLTQSAEWCGPCQSLAALMYDDQEEIRSEVPNFIFYELLYQDNSYDEPARRTLNNWKDAFGLEGIPVVAPEDNTSEEMNWINQSGGIPSTMLIAPNGEVIWTALENPRQGYLSSAQDILSAIEDYEAGE